MTESESQQFETIRSWLNGKKNYQSGVMLLRVYHPDQDKVKSLERYENDFLLNQLMRELYDALKEKKSQVESSEQQVKVTDPLPLNVSNSTPLVEVAVKSAIKNPKSEIPKARDLKKIEEIKKARTQLYKERAAFHKQMSDIAYLESGTLKPVLIKHEIERRHELCKLIMAHTDEIDKYWTIQDYYEVHGVFPSSFRPKVAKPTPLTNAEALRQLMNIRSTITKTEKKISDNKVMLPHQTGRDLDKNKESIAKWEAKLTILKADKLELEKQIREQKDN